MSTLKEISQILKKNNNIYILTHRSPDGDTLGSGYALCLALQSLGKNAKVLNSDNIPDSFLFMQKNIIKQDFEPQLIVSVDVADVNLLGKKLSVYKDKIDICIDHHKSRYEFAPISYIESDSAATAEIIYNLINEMGVDITKDIADCIYTGLATDTGCFKYSNTTIRSFTIAATLMEKGADCANINRIMFDTKSKERIELERTVLQNMKFYFNDKVAVVYYTRRMIDDIGATDDDTSGIASIPGQIKGVLIGVTMKEDSERAGYKISLRSNGNVDVAKICESFGGGGHKAAAGAFISKPFDEARDLLLSEIDKHLRLYK